MYSLIFYAVICIPIVTNALSLFADDILCESGDQVTRQQGTLSQTQLTHLYTAKYMPSISILTQWPWSGERALALKRLLYDTFYCTNY